MAAKKDAPVEGPCSEDNLVEPVDLTDEQADYTVEETNSKEDQSA